MHFHVITIFPELFPGPLGAGVVGRALQAEQISMSAHDLRDHAEGPHRQVDDAAYGGVAGMVLKPEPLKRAVDSVRAAEPRLHAILLSPQGRPFTQDVAHELATHPALLLVCGRYQGVDERAIALVDEQLSIGDYVLSGDEVAAMVVIEATARLVPGVVGSPESLDDETFSSGTAGGLAAPLYTRPAVFDGLEVPAVLRGGDHAAIARWRREQAMMRTERGRPDLVRSDRRSGGK
ncbi:MAG: tRNA (guanosine(37)-N1)-methyltransferase TrmD [Candidatus Dormibacteraeota bacterium]|nr:tRNA (guanosine(37)-N1)-methyltransferase TrmD [Candidatus Dormibacteraeota bacterium]